MRGGQERSVRFGGEEGEGEAEEKPAEVARSAWAVGRDNRQLEHHYPTWSITGSWSAVSHRG